MGCDDRHRDQHFEQAAHDVYGRDRIEAEEARSVFRAIDGAGFHNEEVVTVQSDLDPEEQCKAVITGISPLSGMLLAKKEDGSVLELFPDTHSMNLMDKLIYKKKLNLCVCWN